MLFSTFEKSNEQSTGAERWGRSPNCKAVPLREECVTQYLLYPKGMVLVLHTMVTTQGRKEQHGGVLQSVCSFATEQILQINPANLRHAWNHASS